VPIITKEEAIGFILGGNDSAYNQITKDDAELLSILANQISQALENARLYEEIWDSHQQLEMRIKERTQELARANEELIRLNKMKSDFVSAVSHELRTPLTSIKGYAAILIEGKLGEITPAIRERLEKINKHSDSLTKMVNDMLDISRIESGKVEMKFEKLEVKDVVDRVVDVITPQIKEKGLKLEIDVPAKISSMFADSTQIERVFVNLLSNAIKFTPSQGNIGIKAKEGDRFIEIEISDTGSGISEEELPRIFDEFFRCENPINREVKGTGLGLSLVKQIIEAHKGKIWVKSRLNEGTKFSFTLPKFSSP
jgi:two-component system phosphate regulon sensor histidine kinase PhoR